MKKSSGGREADAARASYLRCQELMRTITEKNALISKLMTSNTGKQQNAEMSKKPLGVMPKTRHNIHRVTFSVAEVAKLFGVGKNTIYDLTYSGKLVPIQIGRRKVFWKYEVYDFLAREQQKAKELLSKGENYENS